jgi:hypothetical protein
VALELEIPAPVGFAEAVKVTFPLREAFQLQVARIFGDVPVVRTLMQPGIRTLFALKVTLEVTVTYAFIAIAVL